MKELLDFKQTRDVLYAIQKYDRGLKWTPSELPMGQFIFYVLIKHNSNNLQNSIELIVNKIAFVTNEYNYRDLNDLYQSILKDLIYYYENNNDKIKVDKFNVDLMQNFVDQADQPEYFFEIRQFKIEMVEYFLNNAEHKNINNFFSNYETKALEIQRQHQQYLKREQQNHSDANTVLLILAVGLVLFIGFIVWILNYQ
jgi:L-2-hydroxyglutarate oxidase LhgO